MGDAPEEPSQEEVEGTKYDKEKWEKLAQGSAALAIEEGKKIGVPEEELYQFALDVIARETQNRHFGFVYRFMKSMGIGTAKEVKAAGEQAYHSFLESGEAGSAMNIARDVYGSDSEEWERANKLNEAERKKQKKEVKMKEKVRSKSWMYAFLGMLHSRTYLLPSEKSKEKGD